MFSLNRHAALLIEQEERKAELAKRSRPRENADFATMYNELALWRQQETAKIKVIMMILSAFFASSGQAIVCYCSLGINWAWRGTYECYEYAP